MKECEAEIFSIHYVTSVIKVLYDHFTYHSPQVRRPHILPIPDGPIASPTAFIYSPADYLVQPWLERWPGAALLQQVMEVGTHPLNAAPAHTSLISSPLIRTTRSCDFFSICNLLQLQSRLAASRTGKASICVHTRQLPEWSNVSYYTDSLHPTSTSHIVHQSVDEPAYTAQPYPA